MRDFYDFLGRQKYLKEIGNINRYQISEDGLILQIFRVEHIEQFDHVFKLRSIIIKVFPEVPRFLIQTNVVTSGCSL